MFKKLFQRKSVPQKEGKSPTKALEGQEYVKVFELELSNMEDTPVYTLSHQLSIGSEIGNIIIADPSVSPRHASFILQQEVVSVIDHGSVAGTFVNGKQIDSGKYIILEENDVVMVGDLEVKIRSASAIVKKNPALEELEEEQDEVPETLPSEEIQEEPLPPKKEEKKEAFGTFYSKEKNPGKKEPPKKVPPKKNKKKFTAIAAPITSANALVRVLAIFGDFLFSYGLIIILSPFDEFRDFLKIIPSIFEESLLPLVLPYWTMVEKDYKFVTDVLSEGYKFLTSHFDIVSLLIIFFTVRLLSTLIFGVTFSEFFLGVRSHGNKIWGRVGGMIRVVIGMITWPFLIFDLPAIISRRTFKEIITFTNIFTPSKFLTILGVLFYFPLLLAFLIVSPVLQGLEIPEPIIVSDVLQRRVRARAPQPEPTVQTTTNEAGETVPVEASEPSEPAPVIIPLVAASRVLNLNLSYSPKEATLIPDFKFTGNAKKLSVKAEIVLFEKELQRSIEVEVFKNFDLKELLGIGLRGNVFLSDKYPKLYEYVHSEEANPAFKKNLNLKTNLAFSTEFIEFTKNAFSLSLENVLDVMQEQTPLIKGFIDYRSSLLALIEYKEFTDIGFIKIGDLTFMKISFIKQKPFDLLIPLARREGKILKVTFDKKENINALSNKLYKYILDKSEWFPLINPSELTSVSSALDVFDLFSTPEYQKLFQSSELAQSLYGFYYEKTGKILTTSQGEELSLWKNKVENFLKLLETLPVDEASPAETELKTKLLQNFRDLFNALETGNQEYFGISRTQTV